MHIGTQLLAAALLIVTMTLVHGAGLVGITKLLKPEKEELARRRLDWGAFGLMISVALSLFLLHALEIALFASFYLMVGALHGLDEALFFSASSYATLGSSVEGFPVEWRLVGAIEGVAGFVLLGWSTAVFVTDMNALLRKR